MSLDVLCVHLPKFESNVVPAALAILKGIAVKNGLRCQTIDFNLDWVDTCVKHHLDRRDCLGGINWDNIPNDFVKKIADQSIVQWATVILDKAPKLLAISIFTYYGQYFAYNIVRLIRQKNPNIHIVLGGAGVSDGILNEPNFAIHLHQHQLIDEYTNADAEASWLTILNNYFNLGLSELSNTFLNIEYINDYSDFEFERYRSNAEKFLDNHYHNGVVIAFNGSEGCVRSCDFCEVHRRWNYRQRTAEHIEKNLIGLLDRVNSCHVAFSDSLVNGNLREFNRILDVLIQLKIRYPEFSWSGQFIVRSEQQCPERFYEKLARSGVTKLSLGIETGSERLRAVMNKPFTNSDLDFTLSMFEKYSIRCTFLQFIGHPEETEQDFQETLDMYTKYRHYANRVINNVELNYLMSIFPNTPLYDKSAQLGLKFVADPGLWYSTSNPTLTVKERMRRRFILSEHLDNLDYRKAHDDHVQMAEYARAYSKYKYAIKIINRS